MGAGDYRLSERGIIVPACGSAGAVGHLGEAEPSRCELRSDCLQTNVACSAQLRLRTANTTTVDDRKMNWGQTTGRGATGCDISGPWSATAVQMVLRNCTSAPLNKATGPVETSSFAAEGRSCGRTL